MKPCTIPPASRLLPLASLLIAAILAGCAADTSRDGGYRGSIHDKLVLVQVVKQPATSSTDCAVSVRITNRMRGTNWDGVSYHLGLLNRKNATVGKLIGAPRRYTRFGDHLEDSGKVLGARCDELVGISVVYFGYYPPGKRQESLHLSHVKAELR